MLKRVVRDSTGDEREVEGVPVVFVERQTRSKKVTKSLVKSTEPQQSKETPTQDQLFLDTTWIVPPGHSWAD